MQGRNKIIDSKIEESIRSTVEKEENSEAREAADQVSSLFSSPNLETRRLTSASFV